MKQVRVKTSERTYPVIVGNGLGAPLRSLAKEQVASGRLLVCCDANFYALHGRQLIQSFERARISTVELVIPSGEKAKSPHVLSGVYDFLLSERITREDFILAVGGGATSDLVGFAAATTLRGINWGVVPTTLVGMVDAAIGGKTGLNHERGKNLIGAFWQPSFVCCDVQFLATLQVRQIWSGLGEVAKTAGLAGAKEMKRLAQYLDRNDLYDAKALSELVLMCVAYKAKVVARDERDRGARLVLNYGHTFGHGIEKTLGFGKLLHGEAVLIGIEAALVLGEKLGYDSKALAEYRNIISEMLSNLPKYRIDADRVWQAMALDKKRTAKNNRYVILENPGRPIVTDKVRPSVAKEALNQALRSYKKFEGHHA